MMWNKCKSESYTVYIIESNIQLECTNSFPYLEKNIENSNTCIRIQSNLQSYLIFEKARLWNLLLMLGRKTWTAHTVCMLGIIPKEE